MDLYRQHAETNKERDGRMADHDGCWLFVDMITDTIDQRTLVRKLDLNG